MNTMNEWLWLLPVFAGGAALGIFFFGGLLLTVQNGLSARHPAVWFILSIVLRTGVVLAGFYFLGSGEWERFVACLLGFMLVRFLLTKRVQQARESIVTQESQHD